MWRQTKSWGGSFAMRGSHLAGVGSLNALLRGNAKTKMINTMQGMKQAAHLRRQGTAQLPSLQCLHVLHVVLQGCGVNQWQGWQLSAPVKLAEHSKGLVHMADGVASA